MAQLRRVLVRHVEKWVAEEDLPSSYRRIDELLERYRSSRLLDDERYAENVVRGLRERGASTVRIRLKLRQREVAEEAIDAALERLSGGEADADLVAARAYARRRRLAHRYDLGQPDQRQKALAALARQGFSYATAMAALAAHEESE